MINDTARLLIITGFILLALGFLFLLIGKLPNGGRLPGDIMIKKENFSFYFPITTCIIVSIILSIIMFFINKR